MVLQDGEVDTQELRYGDEVVLSESATLALLRSSPGIGSYLYADELAPDVPARGTTSVPGIHECAFRLCVQQSYRAQDELDKALAVHNLSSERWRDELSATHWLYPGISVLAHEAAKEAQANERKTSMLRGEVILYGNNVQLQHAWTGSFLSAIREPSEQDSQGILVQLVADVHEGAWFTVLSPGKALRHGARVCNNAHLVLESVRYPGRYLSLNTTSASLDSEIAIEASLLPHKYIRRRLECFLGFQKQLFNARLFQRQAFDFTRLPALMSQCQVRVASEESADARHVAESPTPRRIVGTDIVQLYHREDDAMLVVETKVHASSDINENHAPPERGLAFFMPLEGKQQDPGAKSLFFVQHLHVELGGEEVGPQHVILLQHLVTGLYLCWEGEGSQLTATADFLGRARSNATAKESPPGLTKREWPDEAGNHARPGSHTSVAQAPYASLGNQCEMSLVHVNTTSGAHAPPSKGPSFSFGSAVYITHENRTRSDGELHVRLFLQKSARDTKVGVKLLCAAEGVREPSVSRGLVEVLASDVCMGRAVLDVTCAVSVMNGLVRNIALSEALDLPRDRNGDIDMLARDDYVANHPTTRLILNSVVLLDHIVQNLLGWMEDSAGVAEDLDGEGEGDIGREELGRADFRGGVGGSRGAGSSGTACGAGWGDARRNPGKGSRMQHLVRQHGGVEAVCRLIHTVFWAKQVPLDMIDACGLGEGLLELARKSYRVVIASMRGNDANRRVDFLAIECLFELMRGPPEVISMLREDFFTHAVALLRQARTPAMMMLLSASCIAGDGRPVRENQARVLKFVFEQHPELLCKVRHSLPTLESEPFTANLLVSDRVPGGVVGEVSALDMRDIHDDLLHDYRAAADAHVALFQYYLATLELMSSVVHTRFWPAAKHLMECAHDLACGYNDLLFLIKHEMAPWTLRSLACNLMTALYVDREPFLEVDTLHNVRTWTKLHESVVEEPLNHPDAFAFLPDKLKPPSGFRELKQHCLTHLEKCGNVDMANTAQTLFAQRVADLCLRLARLGAYHAYNDHFRVPSPVFDDIRPLLGLVIGMLDGRTDQIVPPDDVAFAGGGWGEQEALEKLRLGLHPATQVLRDLKVTLCDLLTFFWAVRTDDRVTRFFEKYEQLIDDDVGPALFAAVTRGTEKRKHTSLFTAVVPGNGGDGGAPGDNAIGKPRKGSVLPEDDEDELALPLSYANDVDKWGAQRRPLWARDVVKQLISTLFRTDAYGRETIEPRALKEPEGYLSIATRVFLDLVRYQDPRLSRRAFQLLIVQLGQRHECVCQLACVYLITRPRSARAYFKMRADVHEFRLSIPWLQRDDVARRAEAMLTCETLLQKWTMALHGHRAASEREHMRAGADTDEGEVRRMLFQLNAHVYVMRVLLLPMRRALARKQGELDIAVDKEQQELFAKCHVFVAALCSQHRTLQEFFFAHRRVLDGHLGIIGLPVAETLTAMVTDHQQLVHEAGEEYIRTLFGALRHYQTKRHAWLLAVRAMVLVRSVPVKRHQSVALEYLALHADEFCSLMLGPLDWNLRIDLIFDGELGAVHLSQSRLDYHLACVHLLADCAMGNNPAAEVQVTSLLSWDDIMDVLLDINVRSRGASGIAEALPAHARRAFQSAFVRVLYHAYVKTKMLHPREQVRRANNRLWSGQRVEPPHMGNSTSNVDTSQMLGSELSAPTQQVRMQTPGFLASVVGEVVELELLLQLEADGKVIKHRKDFETLKEYVLADLVPLLTEYYCEFYEAGCSGSLEDTRVSELLFDAFEKLVMTGNLPLDHLPAVQALVTAIGDKVESRGERRKLLEFSVAVPYRGAGGRGVARQLTSPSGKMDAPSLLRDLMTTAARALIIQLAEASGVELSDGEPLGGGLGALVRLCALPGSVPLHSEQQIAFGEGQAGFRPKQNPTYADIVARLADWVALRKSGCGPEDSVVLAAVGSLFAALVYMEGACDEAPRGKQAIRMCWERFRRAQVPAPLKVPQLESLRIVQGKYLEIGALEGAAVLLSRDDAVLHHPALAALNALLARRNRVAQQRLAAFILHSGGGGNATDLSSLESAAGARGLRLARHLADALEQSRGALERFKRRRKFQLEFASAVARQGATTAADGTCAATVARDQGMGWGQQGIGRRVLPEKGSIVHLDWAMAGLGGGGGGGGPSGRVTSTRELALEEAEEAMGESSLLWLALRVLENMCCGGYRPLQLLLMAPLPPSPPVSAEIKVQETELSKQARRRLRAAPPVGSLLEALTALFRRVVVCLPVAVRYCDVSVLRLARHVLACMSAAVDGLCGHNQTRLIEAGVPSLLLQVANLSYRSLASASGSPCSAAADAANPVPEQVAEANMALAAVKVASANLLFLLSLGCAALSTQLTAADTFANPGDSGRCVAQEGGVPVLVLLSKQVDCVALARQASINASLLRLGISRVCKGGWGQLKGSAERAVSAGNFAQDIWHVDIEIGQIGMDGHKGRELLQEELAKYLLVLRVLETEADALALAPPATAPAEAGVGAAVASWAWHGPAQALMQIRKEAPPLWAFASERLRCIELVTSADLRCPRGAASGLCSDDLSCVGSADALVDTNTSMPKAADGNVRRRIVMWFALSDYLHAWNQCGGTRRAAEMSWDALHARGGRGGALVNGGVLLRCWHECCNAFLTWRALRGATALVDAAPPGAPPLDEPRADVDGASDAMPRRAEAVPLGGGEASALNEGSLGRRQIGNVVSRAGAAAGRSLGESLQRLDGSTCLISLLVIAIFLAAYAAPLEDAAAAVAPGTDHSVQETIAHLKFSSGSRWASHAMVDTEWGVKLKPYNPWRFESWTQGLLRALAALHVVAMTCEITAWFVNCWPVTFIGVASERRRLRAAAPEARAGSAAMDVSFMDAGMMKQLLRASVTPYYLLVLGIFSLLGAVHSPMFLLGHTLQLLAPLAPAARIAAPSLLSTSCVSLVVLVCYGLFAFSYFSAQLNEVTAQRCLSPWQCVSTFVLAALARDSHMLEHDPSAVADVPPLLVDDSWEQFRALYSASFFVVWGFLLQGALFAHMLDAIAQHRQLQEARQRDCEHADLLTGQARRAPRGAGAFEAAIQGRQVAVERNEGAGSVGAEMLESDPHSPASWVLFLCWAQEQVRGSRWVLVEDAVDMFARQDPRFLPLLLPS